MEAENKIDGTVARTNDGREAVKINKKRKTIESAVVGVLGALQSLMHSQNELRSMELHSQNEELERRHKLHNMKVEMREKRFNQEIEFLEKKYLMKERALKRKFQERVLEKDLSNLAPNEREKHEIMQARIFKEWMGGWMCGEAKELRKEELVVQEKESNAEIRFLKKKQQMKEKVQKWKFEWRILEKDLSNHAPYVREKYEILQARIQKEWEKRWLSGDANGSDDINT